MSMKEKERQRTYFKERFSYQTKEPKRYTIVIYNDDFTPMDFVMDLLMRMFHCNAAKAYYIMMSVHKRGQGVVGTYTYDVAATKRERAIGMARKAGYPLRLEMKEA